MQRTPAEISTLPGFSDARHLTPLALLRRIPGRNRTKADILVCTSAVGKVAIKDYSAGPWWVRQLLGRFLVRRESARYRAAHGVSGLPRFHGRIGAFALATDWVEARRLADFKDGSVSPVVFDRLERIVGDLHERGIAVADLNYRDVLIGDDTEVHLVDLATSWDRRRRPRALHGRLFERFRANDLFALARLRTRFCGGDMQRTVDQADRGARTWHRRARRVKWLWDRLRGAKRLPPVDDHWRFK